MENLKKPPYRVPSRSKSWITAEQIEKDEEYGTIFLNKLGDVLFTKDYNEKSVSFARNIMDFLIDWDYITWKQYDSFMAIRKQNEKIAVVMTRDNDKSGFYYLNIGPRFINVKNAKLSFTVNTRVVDRGDLLDMQIKSVKTDRDFDSLYSKIFGESPRFEECENEGYCLSYDKSGKRFFSLPTGEEKLYDYF